MKDFDQTLEEIVANYEGRHDHLVRQAPAFYRLLVYILDDPNLPGKLRPLVIAGIAYFILPADIVPEDLEGAGGLVDDVFLCAFLCNVLRTQTKSDAILVDNWDGTTPVLSLIQEVLSKEESMIGDKRELLLWYIGYEYLIKS